MTQEEIDAVVLANASGPKKVTGDQASVEQHSLKDLLEWRKTVGGDEGVNKPHRGLRFTKLIPPGTV